MNDAITINLEYLTVETGASPTWAVIWLHGLGADGTDFASIVPELKLLTEGGFPSIRFIFPHAPVIPVTCNNGYRMRAWYDILYFDDINRHADEAGIRQSREAIRTLITEQNALGIPSENIVLAGFSQGGAMAYTVGLTHPQQLGGIIALSCYLPSPALIAAEAHPANATTPIFAAHGIQDPVVPLVLGEAARQSVSTENRPVDWHAYPMPHSVCATELSDIGTWLTQNMRRAHSRVD